MKSFIPLALLICLCCISGCGPSPKVNAAALVGTYQAKFSFATGTLVLNANGTYQQTVALKAGKTLTTSGRWRFYNNGDDRIELQNFLSAENAGGLITPRITRTTFNASVESYSDGLDIIVNGDLNEFYTKVKSAPKTTGASPSSS